MNATVIIPTLNRKDLLEKCQDSIQKHEPGVDVLVEGLAGPHTFAENCNRGAAEPGEDLLVFLNDDCELQNDAFNRMACVMRAHPEVGIVGAKLTYPRDEDGPKMADRLGTRIQHAGVYLALENGCVMGHHYQDDRPSGPVTAVTGAALMIRRVLFEELGGFDVKFRNGNEDVDLCLRAIRAGWDVWYEKTARITHGESQSGPARWTHVRENIALLSDRWYTELAG